MRASEVTAVLVWTTVLLVVAGARKLAQAPSPSSTADQSYTSDLLSALQGNASASGPILYKTFEAAYFALTAETEAFSQLHTVDANQSVALGNGSRVLVAWSGGNSSLFLAFAASSADNSSLAQSVSGLAPIDYLSDIFGGDPPNANPAALDPFMAVIDNITASGGAIDAVTNGGSVGRVLCTGHSGAAAWAQLCGPWAQVNYPDAQVRVITFGGPRVADEKHDWAVQELVDLPYLWMTASDNRTTAQTPSGPLTLSKVTRIIPEGNQSGQGQPGSIQYYTTLLNNTLKANGSAIPITLQTNFSYGFVPRGKDTQYLTSSAPQGGGFVSAVENAIGTAVDTVSAAGSAISNFFKNAFGGSSENTAPAPAPSGPLDLASIPPAPAGSAGTPRNTQGSVSSSSVSNSSGSECSPVLCKLKPAIAAACAAYNDGASLGPGSVTVSNGSTSTEVAVAWNRDTKVATFAWRGTQETEDWVQNLQLGFSTDSHSAWFTELYAGTEVYEGELNQFRAVTDQATDNSSSILAQLNNMSGGSTPSRVDCIGHSLGAGLATICGPWASEQWPSADIRVVNFGSPKAGNQQFAESVYATVGRIYRAINQKDAVPSLPPFTRYVHADYPIWLNNSQVILDDRNPMDINSLTWNDHGCDNMYQTAILQAANVTVPNWVKNLP